MFRIKGNILVQARMDRYGSLLVRPVKTSYAKKFAKVVKDYTGHLDLEIFIQNPDEFLENDIPRRYIKDLENGYTIRFLADPWIVGHWYGYDAHCIVENGDLR